MNYSTRTDSGGIRRLTAGFVVTALMATVTPAWSADTALVGAAQAATPPPRVSSLRQAPKIQIAILLDTSNSMDGLIDQTRNQLWQVINEFTAARRDGVMPTLEIALFEYGNDGLDAADGYLRRVHGFTRELDRVSQGLFALTTNGGSEYCGYAIRGALEGLQWSRAESDIRAIFIAGNEGFGQGPVDYRAAIELARQLDVAVNTIHAGSHRDGVDDGWQAGARLAGGDYLAIDANRQVVHIPAPQDARIAELNAALNRTYLPFGAGGDARAELQLEQDLKSSGISSALLAKRARTKASRYYRNSDWDLVDALTDGKLGEDEIVALEAEALPEPMHAMSDEEKLEHVREQAYRRAAIQAEIETLSRARDRFVAAHRQQAAGAAPSVSDALSRAVRKQAKRKHYVFVD